MSIITEPIAYQIYDWYLDIERRLSEIVHILPFVEHNQLKKIRSPRLASILLESSSLIDAIMRSQLPDSFTFKKNNNVIKKEKDSTNIEHYFQELEPIFKFSTSQSLLFSGIPSIFSPWADWSNVEYTKLSWWDTYNKLKHDRLKNSNSVTLDTCLQATCALNQVMMQIPSINKYVFRFNWSDNSGYDMQESINNLLKKDGKGFIVYTDFFATFLSPQNYKSVCEIMPSGFRNPDRLRALLSRY